MQLVLISGLSGSGKSVALRQLEDQGYFCIDNLPVPLLLSTVDLVVKAHNPNMAISVDVRSISHLSALPSYVEQLQHRGVSIRLLFLEASTATLIKRFSETRRKHPLHLSHSALTLAECIALERDLLADISHLGMRVDTSHCTQKTLRAQVKQLLKLTAPGLTLSIQSFAFKHGIPLEADFVFDVRCLPNPYYDQQLRALTGRDMAVQDFLAATPLTQTLCEDIYQFISRWLTAFEDGQRSYLSIAIGCTGGQHRSVYVAESLAAQFMPQREVLLRHRELKCTVVMNY